MQSVIQTEIVGGLGVITLNRPKALNGKRPTTTL